MSDGGAGAGDSTLTSRIVPGVPTMICAVGLGMPLLTESLPAKNASTGVYSPIFCTTDMICIASSRAGAMQIA